MAQQFWRIGQPCITWLWLTALCQNQVIHGRKEFITFCRLRQYSLKPLSLRALPEYRLCSKNTGKPRNTWQLGYWEILRFCHAPYIGKLLSHQWRTRKRLAMGAFSSAAPNSDHASRSGSPWSPRSAAPPQCPSNVCNRPSFCREFALTHWTKTLTPPYSILNLDKIVHFVD